MFDTHTHHDYIYDLELVVEMIMRLRAKIRMKRLRNTKSIPLAQTTRQLPTGMETVSQLSIPYTNKGRAQKRMIRPYKKKPELNHPTVLNWNGIEQIDDCKNEHILYIVDRLILHDASSHNTSRCQTSK
eukprot:700318_1